MKSKLLSVLAICLAWVMMPQGAAAQTAADDLKTYANYERYAEANKTAGTPVAVFMGNSITDNWFSMRKDFFTANNYAGRGISGQVTAQMLARFRADVLNLHPKVVVILAGTNDVARNNQYVPVEGIAGNIISMAELAMAHNIQPIILSILPAANYPWRPAITEVPQQIMQVNALLKAYAGLNGVTYVDLFEMMKDERNGLPQKYSKDGVHPTAEGYAVMEPIVKAEIDRLTK